MTFSKKSLHKLQIRSQVDGTIKIGNVLLPPAIDEDYWTYMVPVSENQAIVGFPKFGTIGVGFLREDDWNTNLPYWCPPGQIADHISHNRHAGGDAEVSRDHVTKAIMQIREAAGEDTAHGVKCPTCMGTDRDATHWLENCQYSDMETRLYGTMGRNMGYEYDDDDWPIKNYEDDE